jgi:ribose 5-phosphate isomerase RpiB
MGLRLTSKEIAKEILDAWFSTPPGEGEDAATVARLATIDEYYRSAVRS